MRPILNYSAPIWFTQVSSSLMGKLEVIHNKGLRIATGCHQNGATSHLRAETGPGSPSEGAPRTLLSAVLCHPTLASIRHLLFRPPPPMGYPPCLNYRILRGLRVRSDDLTPISPPLSQTPPTRLDDREDSGLRHPTKCSWPLPLQLIQPNNCCSGTTAVLAPILLLL